MIESIDVQQGFGRTVRISGDEVRSGFSGDPSVCGTPCAAVFDAGYTGSTVNFYRPLRSAGDANARDNLTPASGGNPETLFVNVDTGDAREIGVGLTADDDAPKAGQSVQLKATSTSAGGSAEPTYTWYFGDGTTATGAEVRHTWPAGHWTVGVIASLPDTYGSAARVFDVDGRGSSQVPTPVSTQPPNSGGGAPAKDDGAGGGGGGKGSGTGTGGKNAPADGAKDAPTKGNTPSRSSQGTGKSPATPTPGASATPAPAPTATATGTAAAVTTAPRATPTPAPVASATPDLTRISGRPIGARDAGSIQRALTAADALAREDATAPSSIARAGAGGGQSIVGSAASGILLLGLLGAGALTEWRRARRAARQP